MNNGRPYRPHGAIRPAAELESALVQWARRNRRWLPLWFAIFIFLIVAMLIAVTP